MASERLSLEPYSDQELLSFDRLKRAVMGRVISRAESLMEKDGEFPLSAERTASLIQEEWQKAKEAVRSSPAARAAARAHLEEIISDQIDTLIKTGKDELRAMGVAEKSI